MQKIGEFVIIEVKDAVFYVQENIFEQVFGGSELVFSHSTPLMQLRYSEIVLREARSGTRYEMEFLKCRYSISEIIKTFLQTVPKRLAADIGELDEQKL